MIQNKEDRCLNLGSLRNWGFISFRTVYDLARKTVKKVVWILTSVKDKKRNGNNVFPCVKQCVKNTLCFSSFKPTPNFPHFVRNLTYSRTLHFRIYGTRFESSRIPFRKPEIRSRPRILTMNHLLIPKFYPESLFSKGGNTSKIQHSNRILLHYIFRKVALNDII